MDNDNQEDPTEDNETEWRRLTMTELLELEALHIQEELSLEEPLLTNARRITEVNEFTISDTSLRMPEHEET